MTFDPSPDDRNDRDDTGEVLNQGMASALAYAATVDDHRVVPDAAAVDALAAFREPLPEHGTDPGETLRLLDTVGSPATVASTGGRYFGFVVGGTLPAALATSWLTSAWDQNAGLPAASPSSTTW